jgi:hypothetical protein
MLKILNFLTFRAYSKVGVNVPKPANCWLEIIKFTRSNKGITIHEFFPDSWSKRD